MLFRKKRIQEDRLAEYSTKQEMCRIFDTDKSKLYLLALLLTGDRKKAEKCFVSGLADAVDGMPVFKEWARNWARVTIIQNAHRLVKPQVPESAGSKLAVVSSAFNESEPAERPEFTGVMALGPFERFVFVLSVLERYSDQYCAVFLGCSRREVLDARTRALQQIGDAMKPSMEQVLPALA